MDRRILAIVVLSTVAATPALPPLVAEVSVDDGEGVFPHRVAFDASGSSLGDGQVSWLWSFGDGTSTRDGPTTLHTYVGAGTYVATVALVDGTGRRSEADVTVHVGEPRCPDDGPPFRLGEVEDDDLDDTSGLAASRRLPRVYWVHGDVRADRIVALDDEGETLSEHDIDPELGDVEDMAAVIDPFTGAPVLFIGDFGDNDDERDDVSLWIAGEPDPLSDGVLDPIQVRLVYPDGPRNAETLLVDPITLDAFVITKGDTEVFVKRAPHRGGGPYVLEALGEFDDLDFTATGGDVSPDGSRVVVRGYGETAYLWFRDVRRPLEEVFEEEPCNVDIRDEDQGEAVGFTLDGHGIVTTSEGENEPLVFIGI